MSDNLPVALIPAYKPEPAVIEIAQALASSGKFSTILVVNDSSGAASDWIFDALRGIPGVYILRHHVNLGKGAALKTGLNHAAVHHPEAAGVVTLDADGQHLVEDVIKVAASLVSESGALILGSREFSKEIPLRSRFGNLVTRGVMRIVGGLHLQDTQTGLRGIPLSMVPVLLRLKTTGYDFELDMLLQAKSNQVRIVQVPITTVYIDENSSSHFNPLLDSLKIYLVFLRFNISSLISVLIDYSVFSAAYALGGSLLFSQFLARFSAGSVNYFVNRKFVFKSDRSHAVALSLYIATLVIMGLCSYGLILVLDSTFAMNVYLAKVLSELLLYFASFALQRELIFTRKNQEA